MNFQCKKCDHPWFCTKEQLKNHSRVHANLCTVNFLLGDQGCHEEVVLERESTGLFRCSRCSTLVSKHPSTMQKHCLTCKEPSQKGSNVPTPRSRVTPEPFIPGDICMDPCFTEEGERSYITRTLGYIINEFLHVAICRQCQYIVETKSIVRHSLRVHGCKVDQERLRLDINRFSLGEGNASLREYMSASITLKDPIEGLQVLEGFGCKVCIFYCLKISTLGVHLRVAHGLNRSSKDCYGICFVQQLSRTPGNNRWFGVDCSVKNMSDNPLIDIIRREADERRKGTSVDFVDRDPRNVPLFIKRLNWDNFFQNMDMDVNIVTPLLSSPGQEDGRFFPSKLCEVCQSLMSDFQDTVGSAEALLRRKVKSTKATDISTAPFSRLEQSHDEYAASLVHLIVILLRSLDSDSENDDGHGLLTLLAPLGEPLQQHLHELWAGLREEEDDRQWAIEGIRRSKLIFIQILEDLFFVQRPSHMVPETSLLIYRFVVFKILQQHRVATPDEITHRISIMMYWCRFLVLHKIIHAPQSEVSDFGHQACEESFLLFVREDRRTPFGAILQAKRLIFAITKNENPLPKILWIGDGQIVDGITISIRAISIMIKESIRELYMDLKGDLLMGMPAYNTNKGSLLQSKLGRGLEDNLSDRRVGYSFVSHRGNHCSGYTSELVQHIVQSPSLCNRFVERIEGVDQKIVWNQTTLSRWMHKVGKWLLKLLSIGHLLAGQPARGVEFLTASTTNTHNCLRSVYFVDGLVMLLSFYGKGDNVRGSQRPVARFLCKDTSFLLVNYLTYVRDMEILASKVLYGVDETDLYYHVLPVKEGSKMSSRDLSEGISGIFLKHLKVPLNLNSWRHMAIAWMDRFMKCTDVSRLANCNGPLDSQAGHSQQVASKVYGRSNFDHPNIGRDEFQLYRLVSIEWHKLLRLRTDDHNDPVDDESIHKRVQAEKEQNHVSGGGVDSLTNVHHHHHHEIRVVHPLGNIGLQFPSLVCSKIVIQGLFSLGYTKFKSSYQASAVHEILDRQGDVLAVLPTGGGKTLLFLLPALIESGRLTTVVISPFVALKRDMLCRLRTTGVSVQAYSNEAPPPTGVDILLASVEHCLTGAFQNHLGYLHGQGRLARIVVDECHVGLTSSSWRPATGDLEYIRRVAVPLVLMSATVPPSMEDRLTKFFKSSPSIIRSPTNRPNIAYEVVTVGCSLNDALLSILSMSESVPKSIIFLRGREQTGTVAALICSRGMTAVYYHGHLDATSKMSAQTSWMNGDADIMVATGAFGTGIDLCSVRLIIHVDEPYSMIDMAQESGRGGRDGLPTKHTILLPITWQPREETCSKLQEFISGSRCRRLVLQEYVDGSGLDCFSSGSLKCDVCQSLAAHIQNLTSDSTDRGGTLETSMISDHIDVFGGMDEDTLAILDGPPSKRICLGDVLSSTPAEESRDHYATHRMASLNFFQYLSGAKDKCIICTVNQQHRCNHQIAQCPYMRGLCFKCLAKDHGSPTCRNRSQWRNNQCFGCGLPNTLGEQVLHPERFGPGCNSLGLDKIIPACWFFRRNFERFRTILESSGCPLHINDYEFAKWLTGPTPSYVSNAIHLVILYVSALKS